MKKLSVILVLCGLTTGCGTLIRMTRDNDPNQNSIFMATTTDLAFVSLWLPLKRPPEPSTSFGPSMGLLMCFTPVAIIDLPFAIVMDSILFPFDLNKYRKIAKATRASEKVYEYWEKTFQYGLIHKEDARLNLTDYGQQIVLQKMNADTECRASNIVAVLFDLVTATNDMPDMVYALCSYKGLSPDQYRSLYALSLPYPYAGDIIRINLIQNPVIPVELLSKIAEESNVYHCMEALKTGRLSSPGAANALTRLARSGYWEGQRYAGTHPETPLESLEYLAGIEHPPVIQEAVASNPRASEEILKKLSHAEYVRTRKSVAANRSSSQEVLMTLLEDQNPEVILEAQKTLKAKK